MAEKKRAAPAHKERERQDTTSFTEFEALMPDLVRFILPDRKCRIVLEYDPAAPRVELRREVTEEAQERQRAVCVFKNGKVKIEKR